VCRTIQSRREKGIKKKRAIARHGKSILKRMEVIQESWGRLLWCNYQLSHKLASYPANCEIKAVPIDRDRVNTRLRARARALEWFRGLWTQDSLAISWCAIWCWYWCWGYWLTGNSRSHWAFLASVSSLGAASKWAPRLSTIKFYIGNCGRIFGHFSTFKSASASSGELSHCGRNNDMTYDIISSISKFSVLHLRHMLMSISQCKISGWSPFCTWSKKLPKTNQKKL
jgi:hypothetical protein